MLKVLLKTLKWLSVAVVSVIVLSVAVTATWYFSADMKQPEIRIDTLEWPVTRHEGWTESRGNMFRRSGDGLWEVWLQGTPAGRGTALGRMTEDTIRRRFSSTRSAGSSPRMDI